MLSHLAFVYVKITSFQRNQSKFSQQQTLDHKKSKKHTKCEKNAFRSGSLVERKIVQAKLRKELKEGKTKIENLF